MKSILFFPLLVLFFFSGEPSCKNKNENQEKVTEIGQILDADNQLSDCINEKIIRFKESKKGMQSTQVVRYSSNGNQFFLFDEGMARDLVGYVLNQNCDTICITGGMRRRNPDQPKCPPQDKNSREVLWSNETPSK